MYNHEENMMSCDVILGRSVMRWKFSEGRQLGENPMAIDSQARAWRRMSVCSFSTHAFDDVENANDLKKLRAIAGEVIKKLSGSPLAAKVKEEESKPSLGLGDSINFDKPHSYITDQINLIFKNPNPIKMQICVNIRYLSSLDVPTSRGRGSKQLPVVEDEGDNRAIVNRKKSGLRILISNPIAIRREEAEADDAELRVGRLEEEDGENASNKKGGGRENLVTLAAVVTGERGETAPMKCRQFLRFGRLLNTLQIQGHCNPLSATFDCRPPPATTSDHRRPPPLTTTAGHHRRPPPPPPPATTSGHRRPSPLTATAGHHLRHHRQSPLATADHHRRPPPPPPPATTSGHRRPPPLTTTAGHHCRPPPTTTSGHRRPPPLTPTADHHCRPPPSATTSATTGNHLWPPLTTTFDRHRRPPPPPPPATTSGHHR
ncbi:hypothetical protein IEQ34_007586 [Dendrobium chrysotoxum]|uniref:Uncharacterized protein n=1 Tax=Dendrobium chrysotoxum TaxID=161865 RepID=A0AAV7GMH3_DENCH|nr:hypothetical protein IEQ34_007586 [Dendrobium chrysotoxum]